MKSQYEHLKAQLHRRLSESEGAYQQKHTEVLEKFQDLLQPQLNNLKNASEAVAIEELQKILNTMQDTHLQMQEHSSNQEIFWNNQNLQMQNLSETTIQLNRTLQQTQQNIQQEKFGMALRQIAQTLQQNQQETRELKQKVKTHQKMVEMSLYITLGLFVILIISIWKI